MEKTSGGGFYLEIGPKRCLVAAGVYMPEREQLLALRRWMAENHRSYNAQLTKLLKTGKLRFEPIDPEALTRMPKGFPAEHPAGDLLRAKNWGVHANLPPALAFEPALAREIATRLRRMAPLVETLNQAILAAAGSSQQAGRGAGANAFL
jgi:uncharacterized protein (TIGR02453 family)